MSDQPTARPQDGWVDWLTGPDAPAPDQAEVGDTWTRGLHMLLLTPHGWVPQWLAPGGTP